MTLVTIGGKGTPARTLFWLVLFLIFLSLVHGFELTSLQSALATMKLQPELVTQTLNIQSQLSTILDTQGSMLPPEVLSILQEITTNVAKLLAGLVGVAV